MKIYLTLVAAAAVGKYAEAFSLSMQTFIPPPLKYNPSISSRVSIQLGSTTASATATLDEKTVDTPQQTKTLGLLTFDLDDSLYPIEPVLNDANKVFVDMMAKYGYNLGINDIVEAGKKIREEAGPIAGTAMSHTEVRMEAIRREMERKMLEKKLQECAEDWATEVESLTAPLRHSAEAWAKSAVSESVVESIYLAWERERHQSAERNLYPEVVEALQKIKQEHPNVIVGAVTDGKANPMLMVFSLAPYFDFCMSWEDDANGRADFFKELGNVDGNADLQWIYTAAFEKYKDIADTNREMRKELGEEESEGEPVWIHIGDDLAYDVGGSASCGAKTILLDLDDEYGQTAKKRFDGEMPLWNTAGPEEIVNRRVMNDAAERVVDKRVNRMSMLPESINEILKGE